MKNAVELLNAEVSICCKLNIDTGKNVIVKDRERRLVLRGYTMKRMTFFLPVSIIVKQVNNNCVTYEGITADNKVIISFVNKNGLLSNFWESNIISGKFEYAQLITFDINKSDATIDIYKNIIEFCIYLRVKIKSDVLCMLRQEVYLDIAIPLACTKVLEDPFCGELYAGEMIDRLTEVFLNNPNGKKKDFYTTLEKEVQQKWGTFEWASDYEKEEYKKSLFQLSLLFE